MKVRANECVFKIVSRRIMLLQLMRMSATSISCDAPFQKNKQAGCVTSLFVKQCNARAEYADLMEFAQGSDFPWA